MKTIQRGKAPAREASLLQVFLRESGFALNPDGSFGAGTEAALRQFQRANGLVDDGVAGEKTWTKLFALHPGLLQAISAKWLSQQQIADFAAARGLEIPTVRAVYAVEADGMGFIGLQPKILFEGHVFWKELQAAGVDPSAHRHGNGDILFPSFTPGSYKGGLAEYARLARAEAIHPQAARRAASWGLFQVLGRNAEDLGYADVDAFVAEMNKTEGEHLDSFGRFVAHNRRGGRTLLEWLRRRDWAQFAAGYNGPAFAQNQYDIKLEAAYQKAKAQMV